VVGLAVISTLPLPLLPLQILYLNLVTDVFPAFALAMGEGEPRILRRPPRDPREPILGRVQWTTIVLQSLALAGSTFGALVVARLWLDLDAKSQVTVTFLTLAFAQIFHVFNMRHPQSGLLRNEVTTNPWLWASLLLCAALLAVPPYLPPVAHVLQLVPPSPAMWATILGLGAAPLLVTQAVTLAMTRARPGR
jgi:Ca2+-transporting ATPase